MKNLLSGFLLLSLLWLAGGCSGPFSGQSLPPRVEVQDGFYRVLRTGKKPGKIMPLDKHETGIQFNRKFVAYADKNQRYVVVDHSDFAPLQLSTKPDLDKQEDGKHRLLLNLTEDAKAKLAAFTKAHVNESAAIVVGGEALTIHTIREVIDSGKMQITRCTDDACEMLFVELEDNVAPGSD